MNDEMVVQDSRGPTSAITLALLKRPPPIVPEVDVPAEILQ